MFKGVRPRFCLKQSNGVNAPRGFGLRVAGCGREDTRSHHAHTSHPPLRVLGTQRGPPNTFFGCRVAGCGLRVSGFGLRVAGCGREDPRSHHTHTHPAPHSESEAHRGGPSRELLCKYSVLNVTIVHRVTLGTYLATGPAQ